MYEGFNIAKIEKDSISNGPGIRVILWCQGCTIHCKDCHNPQTWDSTKGRQYTKEDDKILFSELGKPYVQGITLSGGHPLEPYNIDFCRHIAKRVKLLYPSKDVWLYTGWLWEDIKDLEIIQYIDVIVDGPFVKDKRNITLPYCGSTNQRVIDVKQSIKHNKVILYKPEN